MVGSEYQAQIPEGLCQYDDALPYENEDKLVWDPSQLDDCDIELYLQRSMIPALVGSPGNDDRQSSHLLTRKAFRSFPTSGLFVFSWFAIIKPNSIAVVTMFHEFLQKSGVAAVRQSLAWRRTIALLTATMWPQYRWGAAATALKCNRCGCGRRQSTGSLAERWESHEPLVRRGVPKLWERAARVRKRFPCHSIVKGAHAIGQWAGAVLLLVEENGTTWHIRQ